MPPDLDIYGLTKHRDTATINRFLDTYVDRAKSWARGDEALMMEPLPLTHPETGEEGAAWESTPFEWEPALTLSHIIERGLASSCFYRLSRPQTGRPDQRDLEFYRR